MRAGRVRAAGRELSAWKKALAFGLVFGCAAPLLLMAGELLYRNVHGIPVTLWGYYAVPRVLPTPGPDDMSFLEVGYYDIFQRTDNPRRPYEPRPGFSRGRVQINADGFRDHSYPRAKPPGVTRIATLGDSIVWGHGLVLEDTFAKQLEALLKARGPGRYEVLNFGVSGYSLRETAELFLERVVHFEPDIVIVGLSVNDAVHSSIEGDFLDRADSGILKRSFLLDFARIQIDLFRARWLGTPGEELGRVVDVPGCYRRLREAAPDTRWAVLMFPLFRDPLGRSARRSYETLLGPAREQGYLVRNLVEDFAGQPVEAVALDHLHPNARGNAIAARAALESLDAAGWLAPGRLNEGARTPLAAPPDS